MKKHLLLAAIAAAAGVVSASAAEVTFTKDNGSFSGLVWTSTTSPAVTITLNGGEFMNNDAAGICINTAGDTRTVIIASSSDRYYVSGYTMTVGGYSGDEVIIRASNQTVTTGSSEQTVSVSGLSDGAARALFTITPGTATHHKKFYIKELTVTLEPSLVSAGMVTLTEFDRSGWTVSGCGQRGAGTDTDGGFAELFDGNTATFWHSQYGADKVVPHFFVVDLGENHQNYGAFGYLPRQATNANGYVTAYRLYVADNIDGLTTCPQSSEGTYADGSHESLATFLADKTPVSRGSFDIYKNSAASQSLRQVVFDNTNSQTARYLIFVIDDTDNADGSNKHANCAEFYVYGVDAEENAPVEADEANARLAAARTEANSALELYCGILLDSEIDAYAAAIRNAAQDFTELTDEIAVGNALEAISAAFSAETGAAMADGRIVYVRNLRRGNAYLTVMDDNAINTVSYPSERGKWLIVREGTTANLALHNLEVSKYAATGSVADAGTKFYLAANSSDYPGVAMHFVNGDNGFNVDQKGNNLTQYGYNDPGSSWSFELAGVMAEDLVDGQYYRIRNNRGIFSDNGAIRTTGSLIGINSVVEDGATEGERQQLHLRKDGLGVVWQLKAVDGGYQLFSVAADFADQEQPFVLGARGDGSGKEPHQAYAVADAAVKLDIFNARENKYGTYTGHIPYTLGIATPDYARENSNKCMDVSNETGVPVLCEWQLDNRDKDGGSAYYFEALAEEELAAMKEAYIAGAGVDCSEFDAAASAYAGYEALFGDAFAEHNQAVAQLRESLTGEAAQPTDIKTANAMVTENAAIVPTYNEQLSELVAAFADQLPEIAAEADGRQVSIRNVQNTQNLLFAGAANLEPNTNALHLATVWTLEQTDGFKYRLHNYGTDAYAGHYDRTDAGNDGQTSVPVATSETAQEYELTLLGDGRFTLGAGTGSLPLLHNGATGIVKWQNSAASQWTASMIDTEPVIIDYKKVNVDCDGIDGVVNSIMFEPQAGVSLAVSEGLGDHLPIVVECFDADAFPAQQDAEVMAAADAATAIETYTIHGSSLARNEDNALVYAPDEAMKSGVLRMTVPMGFFTVDGKLSAPCTVNFTVDNNGVTTGVTEVGVADDEAAVRWFTVQGVRVAEPTAAGVYVRVAGGKATKVYVGK